MNASLKIQQRAPAVSAFDRQRDLQHGSSIDFAAARQNAADDTAFQAQGIANGNNLLTLLKFVGIAQGERGQIFRIDLQDRQILRSFGRMDRCDIEFPSVK